MSWDFPKISGTSFWGPYNKDPTIKGAILGSPVLGDRQLHLNLVKRQSKYSGLEFPDSVVLTLGFYCKENWSV